MEILLVVRSLIDLKKYLRPQLIFDVDIKL